MAPYSLVEYYQRFLGVYPNLHNEDVDNISSETRVTTYQCGRFQIPKRLKSTFDKGIEFWMEHDKGQRGTQTHIQMDSQLVSYNVHSYFSGGVMKLSCKICCLLVSDSRIHCPSSLYWICVWQSNTEASFLALSPFPSTIHHFVNLLITTPKMWKSLDWVRVAPATFQAEKKAGFINQLLPRNHSLESDSQAS